MVTTVTLNPMVDKTLTIDRLRRGEITRATAVQTVAGGKGVNVSRQLTLLGVETLATGFIGGETGDLHERLLDEEQIPHDFVRVAGMTREGISMREPDGTVTSVFDPPHPVTADEVARLLDKCRLHVRKSSWLVCSGSSPAEQADGLFCELVQLCRKAGVPVVVDSYGKAFERAVGAVPTLVKPNRQEFERTFGQRLDSETSMIEAARELVSRGVQCCLITDGEKPFVAASRDGAWMVTPPRIRAVNPTGSGDSLVAALLSSLLDGKGLGDSLAFAAAAGAANAAVWDVAACTRDEIIALLPDVVVRGV